MTNLNMKAFSRSCSRSVGPAAEDGAARSLGRVKRSVPAVIAPMGKPMAIGALVKAVTGEDGLSAQISKKFVSRRSDVECRVDDPAVEGASLARLADRQDTPLVGDFVRDLHRTVLVARGDNRRTAIPQVGKERPCVRGRHPKEAEGARGRWCCRISDYVDGHAGPRDRWLFRDDPKCEEDAATANLDRCVPRSNRGCWGLITGGWRCGRLRGHHPRFLDGEVRSRCAGRGATNRCEGHRGSPARSSPTGTGAQPS